MEVFVIIVQMKKLFERYRYSVILLRQLVKTDFKLRYEGSVLGMVWSALKPLMLFAVMYTVFVHFLRFGGDTPYFATSLLLGISLWSFFSEATATGMQAIVQKGDLLRKINFPRYILVVSATVNALINLLINLVVLLIVALIDGVNFHWHILLLPLVILQLYTLSLAVAFLLSALYVKFRDISHIWEVVMQAGFYATPIIYPLSMIIGMAGPKIAKIFIVVNPMAQIIQDARYLVVYPETETVWNFIGNFWIAIIPVVMTFVLVILAAIYFRKNSHKFAEMV
jgi:ABC-type polysaccharide/polyol phosphate export systems, permease component